MQTRPQPDQHAAYFRWLARVEAIITVEYRDREPPLEVAQVPADLLQLGFESGDTPAEFVAGALAPIMDGAST